MISVNYSYSQKTDGSIISGLCDARAWESFDGKWRGNDGGTYYLRESDDGRLYWLGMSSDSGKTWTNVFIGTIYEDKKQISGQWADVPLGKISQSGMLLLNYIEYPEGHINKIERIKQTGGFGGSEWYKPCDDVIYNNK